MSASFEFATAGRVVVGEGAARQLPALVREWGRRFLVVTGRSPDRVSSLLRILEEGGLETVRMSVAGEPGVEEVVAGAGLARARGVEGVIGLGGGSAVDAAKAVAALASNPGDPLRYLEVIGEGRPLEQPPLPFVAVPTTAGTGAEVTRNAVLTSRERRVKVSLRSASMLARLAVVDPELTWRMGVGVTVSTGLDALTQLIEPFVSCRANPLTDALCREGIVRAARSLRAAVATARRVAGAAVELTPDERAARLDLSVAALFSGLALANAGLGVVHGFAGPLGGLLDAPHGAVCAALLPGAMAVNIAAARALDARHPSLDRYAEVARLLTGQSGATPEEGVRWVETLCVELEVARLPELGVKREHVPVLVEGAARASSMKGNPVPLSPAQLETVLVRAGVGP